MKLRLAVLAAALVCASPLAAQEHGQHAADHGDHHDGPPPYVSALLTDIGMAERKLVGLAEAIPEDRWGWRPAEGVRSVGEVFMHVAADNYLLPAMAGVAAPAETGIRGDDYNTAVAYEQRVLDKAGTIEALRASFAHLRDALADVDHDALHTEYEFFGSQMTGMQLWIATATHLHEHLGQSIAYARSNNVTPPWSRGN